MLRNVIHILQTGIFAVLGLLAVVLGLLTVVATASPRRWGFLGGLGARTTGWGEAREVFRFRRMRNEPDLGPSPPRHRGRRRSGKPSGPDRAPSEARSGRSGGMAGGPPRSTWGAASLG